MTVLILVVVDNGLVHLLMQRVVSTSTCLNPCCSGLWTRTSKLKSMELFIIVLILVIVDDDLVPNRSKTESEIKGVLILVIVDDGLVHN